MALPASGNPISISQILTEFDVPQDASSLETLSTGGTAAINALSTSKPNDAAPYALSEFYSYDHAAGLTELALNGPHGDPNAGCGQAGDTGFFHDGGGSPYAIGVTYYQIDDVTGPVADTGFYMYGDGISGISIDGSGQVDGVFDC